MSRVERLAGSVPPACDKSDEPDTPLAPVEPDRPLQHLRDMEILRQHTVQLLAPAPPLPAVEPSRREQKRLRKHRRVEAGERAP